MNHQWVVLVPKQRNLRPQKAMQNQDRVSSPWNRTICALRWWSWWIHGRFAWLRLTAGNSCGFHRAICLIPLSFWPRRRCPDSMCLFLEEDRTRWLGPDTRWCSAWSHCPNQQIEQIRIRRDHWTQQGSSESARFLSFRLMVDWGFWINFCVWDDERIAEIALENFSETICHLLNVI